MKHTTPRKMTMDQPHPGDGPETPEQRAREMLARMNVPGAQSMSSGDLVEIANLIAEDDAVEYHKTHDPCDICTHLEVTDLLDRLNTAEAEIERLRAQTEKVRAWRDGLSPTLTGQRAELDAILDKAGDQ